MRNKLAVVLNLVENGEAFYPLTKKRPIATLPFNGRYRLIDFLFSSMYHAELLSAAIFIGGSGHSLYDHIRNGASWGLDSSIGGGVFTHSRIQEQLEYLATDDERFTYYDNHRSYINKTSADIVLIAGSRVLTHIDLNAFIAKHRSSDHAVTAAYHSFNDWQPSAQTTIQELTLEGGEVKGMQLVKGDKTQHTAGIQMAIADKDFVLQSIDIAEENGEIISTDNIIKYALQEDLAVGSYEITGYVKILEDLNDYYEANMDMLDENKFEQLMIQEGAVVTRFHHGAPTYYGSESKVHSSNLATGSVVFGKVDHSIIFRKTFIAPTASISHSVIMNSARIGEKVHLEYCILDKDVTVIDGVTIQGTAQNPVVVEKGAIVAQDIIQS